MIIERDVQIRMPDGIALRCNIYRPNDDKRHPVVMAMGIYGKDVHFEDAFTPQWRNLKKIYPALTGTESTGKYLRWENVDPERWVPHGYVVVTIDARGSGKTPGYLDPHSPQEARDYYDAIGWAGEQPWSSGRVGLIGVSYFAINQWRVAAMRPPYLAAIIPWEGGNDLYRDSNRHGGILSSGFRAAWWARQVLVNQHGSTESPYRDRETGERTTGPTSLTNAQMEANRAEPTARWRFELDDEWTRERTPRLEQIEVPLLTAANWGGAGLHLRGNFEGFVRASSTHKWLFAHIGTHYESFYLPRYVQIQQSFFDHFLKRIDNGWDREPKVQLAIRNVDGTAHMREETVWPLAGTEWKKFFLDADQQLSTTNSDISGSLSYEALGEGLSFSTGPFKELTEFTGPVVARLWVSTSTTDMDVFAALRVFDPDNKEVTFVGAHEHVPMALGWLRASHRKLDHEKSFPWRPFHSHDEIQKLEPNEVYALDVEIWPTSMVFPKGWRLVLTLKGEDFVVAPPGRMLHNDPDDRDAEEFGGNNTVYFGGDHASYLLMPLIPSKR